MRRHFFGDTAVLTGRSLKHITRSMDTILTTAVTPIAMMLLFVYVFGGAISTGMDNYVNYLLPGILLIAIASGIAYTAYRLFLDVQKGIFKDFLPAQEEVEEAPQRREQVVDTVWLHLQVGPHIKKVGGREVLPIGIGLFQVTIKDKKMSPGQRCVVPQVMAVSDKLVQLGGEETFKVLHGKAPSS